MLAYQQSRPGFIFSGKFVKEITSLLREWKESIIIKHHLERLARCLSFYTSKPNSEIQNVCLIEKLKESINLWIHWAKKISLRACCRNWVPNRKSENKTFRPAKIVLIT